MIPTTRRHRLVPRRIAAGRIAAAALLLALILSPLAAHADWTFTRGDTNGDAAVDLSDAIAGLGFLFSGDPAACLDALDTNDDGANDLSDPISTLGYLFNAGSPPPSPFPDCGTDPTPDTLDCVGPLTSCPDDTALPNIVLIVADDFGVDLMSAYGEGADTPCTPRLDALAAQGLLYRNAWAAPACSPTRATIQTGRYGFRTGIGTVIQGMAPGLSLAETTIPEVIGGYSTAYLGKWHLSGNLGNMHPNQSGYDHFAGTVRGALPDYSSWTKIVNGQPTPTTNYATIDTADDAITTLTTLPEPWFAQVNFHAPHDPWHAPPIALCPATCPTGFCSTLPPNPNPRQFVKAMVESMDSEIGRVLDAIDSQTNTYVIFIGDNGTVRQATEAPFNPMHAKGTVYEGGVNIPFVVRGPGVVAGETAALVGTVDLFATVAELAGETSTAEDSVSLVPTFTDPAATVRTTIYAETFQGSASAPPITEHERAIRDARYKLIRVDGEPDEFYDLLVDPFESTNLLPTLTAAQQVAHDALVAELVALGVD